MHRYRTISLIDPNGRCRAERSAAIIGERFHVEPYESFDEFRREGNTDSLILIYDDGESLPALIADMRERDYWAPALGYGRQLDPVGFSKVLLLGFIGYLPNPFDYRDLTSILDAYPEELSAVIDLRYEAAEARRKLKLLTNREVEVLDHLKCGLRNREIAERLHISARTVEVHRANLLRKMDVTSAFTAIRMSVQATIGI